MAMSRRRKIMLGLVLTLTALFGGIYLYLAWPTAEYQPYQYGRADREKLPRMTLVNHEEIMSGLLGEPAIPVMTIGILVYDGVDTLEAVAPMVVFSELMGVKLEYVGRRSGVVASTLAELVVEHSIDDIDQLDVLVVPGGNRAGLEAVLDDSGLHDWLRRIDAGSMLTAAIGDGALLLAKAGLLQDRSIAFGWPQAQANTAAVGAKFVDKQYTNDSKYWTSVGGAAAIDQSLAMLQAIAGTRHLQAAMLDLEYDPEPPFRGGTADTTPPEILEALSAQTWQRAGLSLLDATATDSNDGLQEPLQIGILVYEDFFTLDAIGPLAVLSQIEGAKVRLVRFGDQETIKSGRTRLRVPTSTADVDQLDLLLVPGGSNGTWSVSRNPAALDWIRAIDARSRYTASVCTGSWILGAAGLLKDRRATSNWYRAGQMMTRYGAQFMPQRYVADGKYWTSAGVSAGIDLSFALIAQLRGEPAAHAAMMRLHYRPTPPIDAGSPEKTEDLVLDMMVQMYDYVMVPLIREP